MRCEKCGGDRLIPHVDRDDLDRVKCAECGWMFVPPIQPPTPGPWEVTDVGRIAKRCDNHGGRIHFHTIAEVGMSTCVGGERNANRKLIAASPEMLEALKLMATMYKDQPGSKLEDIPDDFIHAAIAKAEGKS